MNQKIYGLAQELGRAARAAGAKIATAESCTAGGIAYAITEVAGSSEWLDRGYVTYSVRAKHEMLGVEPALVRREGVVSEAVAAAMARGAVAKSGADCSVAVTGIAGPGGAEPGRPVGTVCFGWGLREQGHIVVRTETRHFDGGRESVRLQTVEAAIAGLITLLKGRGAR
ncbi:CinA family protein [Mesosutterella sp. OilRF-GAM-744-9]|uniref:CinA family protein n=1 Tax=Mesosutterella porci TaxID=2915351 RepID=A0ABS9MRI3_9BURK|nr:CinA family protein [Mesosutterella sp. oilRF-744-WT-GAM-9]MCG5031240.1 CinA family protein [Mesosutterella sp. oilRF-744-WT-GAM-9]MCI6529780.1 CinA family protein [Mesosutterella sp.]